MKRKAVGTYHIAKICQVAPITVGRWMEEGKMPFFTTGGGHRRVWLEDFVKFLEAHNYPVPKDFRSPLTTNILVVEDEQSARRLIHRALEKIFPQAKVLEATTGYEAGELISTLNPKIVILDVWLPGLNGIDVCKRIRLNNSRPQIKIVAISGDTSEETREAVLKAGADAFLAKPFTNNQLLDALSKFVDGTQDR